MKDDIGSSGKCLNKKYRKKRLWNKNEGKPKLKIIQARAGEVRESVREQEIQEGSLVEVSAVSV